LAKVMPVIATRAYDPSFEPWWTKRGMTLGMGMTEKQGGTDVRSNMTRAERDGGAYRITGHKWFMSAPMCDAFLVLAQADEGLSCFFMPRFRPDGSVNAIHFQRLKDKLGNRSNASSEVEFHGAYAERIGDDGGEAAYMRLLTPAVKYWVCKSAPGFLYEAMECLGGNGYVEEGILARHFRESPVNAIWEGSGNVMCLDVLRALSREPEAAS